MRKTSRMVVATALAVAATSQADAEDIELHIPETSSVLSPGESLQVPHHFINHLQIHIAKQLSGGSVFARVNGRAAGPVMSTLSGRGRTVVELDLNRYHGFRLHPGRNSVEAWVVDRFGTEELVSFVISTGEKGSRVSLHIQQERASPDAPFVLLNTPAGPVFAHEALLVEGVVDSLTETLSVSVDGGAAQVRRRPQAEYRKSSRAAGPAADLFRFDFSKEVTPGPGRSDVEILASDASGQTSRTVIPVYPATGLSSDSEKFAVVVGISAYQAEDFQDLAYADDDARTVADWLVGPGGFRKENVLLLVDAHATHSAIRSALFSFLASPEPQDFVLIYFAGHGARDPKAPRNLYLLPHDTAPDNIGGTAIPMWDVERIFTKTLRTRRVVTLVDSCHSGGVAPEITTAHNLVNQGVYRAASGMGQAVLAASDVGEYAEESVQWKGGVFTYYLMKGLGGAADSKRDGSVTVRELFDYVRRSVRTATDGRQTPVPLPGLNGKLELASLTEAPRDLANP